MDPGLELDPIATQMDLNAAGFEQHGRLEGEQEGNGGLVFIVGGNQPDLCLQLRQKIKRRLDLLIVDELLFHARSIRDGSGFSLLPTRENLRPVQQKCRPEKDGTSA